MHSDILSLQLVFPKICSRHIHNKDAVSKNVEFHADFESVEKVLKKCTIKKLLGHM
jgi:hypothetical protein